MPLDRPRFRRDLLAEAVEADGQRYVDVHDPVTGASFRLYDFEYHVALAFDGLTFDKIIPWLKLACRIEVSTEQLAEFAAHLRGLGFLEPDGDDATTEPAAVEADTTAPAEPAEPPGHPTEAARAAPPTPDDPGADRVATAEAAAYVLAPADAEPAMVAAPLASRVETPTPTGPTVAIPSPAVTQPVSQAVTVPYLLPDPPARETAQDDFANDNRGADAPADQSAPTDADAPRPAGHDFVVIPQTTVTPMNTWPAPYVPASEVVVSPAQTVADLVLATLAGTSEPPSAAPTPESAPVSAEPAEAPAAAPTSEGVAVATESYPADEPAPPRALTDEPDQPPPVVTDEPDQPPPVVTDEFAASFADAASPAVADEVLAEPRAPSIAEEVAPTEAPAQATNDEVVPGVPAAEAPVPESAEPSSPNAAEAPPEAPAPEEPAPEEPPADEPAPEEPAADEPAEAVPPDAPAAVADDEARSDAAEGVPARVADSTAFPVLPTPPPQAVESPRPVAPVVVMPLVVTPSARQPSGRFQTPPPYVTPAPSTLGPLPVAVRRRQRRSLLLFGSLGVLTAAAVLAFFLPFFFPARGPALAEVRTVAATPGTIFRYFAATGTVSPLPGPVFKFPAGGKVIRIAKPGAAVAVGDVLAAVEGARPLLTQLAHQRERLAFYQQMAEGMRQVGNTAEEERQNAKVEERRAKVGKTLAAVAEVAVVARSVGEVDEIFTQEGETVEAGSLALRLISSGHRATFDLPAAQAAEARRLGFCQIGVDGYMFDCVHTQERTDDNRVSVDLPNLPRTLVGRPARLARARFEDAVALPASAILSAGRRHQVYVVSPAGRVEARPVTLAEPSGGEAIVVQGLDGGDSVVIEPPADLRPGTPVNARL